MGSVPDCYFIMEHSEDRLHSPANKLQLHPRLKAAFKADYVCLTPDPVSDGDITYSVAGLHDTLSAEALAFSVLNKTVHLDIDPKLAFTQAAFTLIRATLESVEDHLKLKSLLVNGTTSSRLTRKDSKICLS